MGFLRPADWHARDMEGDRAEDWRLCLPFKIRRIKSAIAQRTTQMTKILKRKRHGSRTGKTNQQ
ncbi:hypothetical protein IFR05_016676 [Cadophora sp. M221]|nr:hypothetical protein IFR05_016676 [Cadophora sp. M221]